MSKIIQIDNRFFIKVRSKKMVNFFEIDEDDINRVSAFNWSLHKTGYAVANIGYGQNGFKSTILLHRLILSFPNSIIDHKNLNKKEKDNRSG